MYPIQLGTHAEETPAPGSVLKNVLLNCAFQFTALPLKILERITECGLAEILGWTDIKSELLVTPQAVIDFLTEEHTTTLIQLPQNISKTPFQTPDAVERGSAPRDQETGRRFQRPHARLQ